MGQTAPFWRFSAASYLDLEEKAVESFVRPAKRSINADPSSSSSVSEVLFDKHLSYPSLTLSCISVYSYW